MDTGWLRQAVAAALSTSTHPRPRTH